MISCYWVAGAAGHVDPGETARHAATREAQEEIGVTIHEQSLELVSVMQRTDATDNPREQRIDWFWTTRGWDGTPTICEKDKMSRLQCFPLNALPQSIPDYELIILQGIAAGGLPMDTAVGFAS